MMNRLGLSNMRRQGGGVLTFATNPYCRYREELPDRPRGAKICQNNESNCRTIFLIRLSFRLCPGPAPQHHTQIPFNFHDFETI